MSQSSDEEDATSRKQRKIEETEETLMHRETPEISSKATPIEDEDGVILKNIKTEDRLEDVFQDETIKAFTMIIDFEKFARSKRGLCLEEYDLTCIKENEKNVEAQKMAMLNRWREINATPIEDDEDEDEKPNLKTEATPIEDDEDEDEKPNLKTEDHLEDVFQDDTIKSFAKIVDFKMFARSSKGLGLKQYDIQCIIDNEENVEEQKLQMLFKWRQLNGTEATAMKIHFLVESFRNHLNPDSKDFIKLGNGTFVMYKKKTLGHGNNVFLGEKISDIEGCSHPCVIKLTIYNKASLREAKALTKLGNHENVVSILHVGKYCTDLYNYIYIAMNLAWTNHLRDVLEKCKQPNSFDQIINLYRPLDLVFQVLKGLVHIHDHCIIHRDLKPENVLVSEDYKNIKINDFGICKPIDDGSTTILTNQGIGSEGYRSPETYNASEISLSSDVYSVGIMIAEMISNGRHPFGDNSDLWKINIKKEMNPDLSHLCISNKSQMEELLKQMMHPNPNERPTAREVLNSAALEQAQPVYPLSFGSSKEQSTTQKEITIENEYEKTSMSEAKEKRDFFVEEIKVWDEDETTFMSETDGIHDFLVEEDSVGTSDELVETIKNVEKDAAHQSLELEGQKPSTEEANHELVQTRKVQKTPEVDEVEESENQASGGNQVEWQSYDKNTEEVIRDLLETDDISNKELADQHKKAGTKFLNAGKCDDAIEEYTLAISIDSDNYVLHSNRSYAHAKKGNHKASLFDAEEVIRLRPNWAKGYIRKGLALKSLGRSNEAIEILEAGLRVDSDDEELKTTLQGCEMEIQNRSASPRISVQNKTGESGFGSEEMDLATMLAIAQSVSGNGEDLSIMPELSTKTTAPDEPSMPDIDKSKIGLAEEPKHPTLTISDPKAEMVGWERLISNPKTSNKRKRKHSESDDSSPRGKFKTTDPDIKTNVAKFNEPEVNNLELEIYNQNKDAINSPIIGELKVIDKDKAEKEKDLGTECSKRNEFERAHEHYDKAITFDPTDVSLYANKALVYTKQKIPLKVRELSMMVVEIIMKYGGDKKIVAKSYSRIAKSYLEEENYETALAYFKKVKELNPCTATSDQIRICKKKIYQQEIIIGDEDVTTSMSETDETHNFLVEERGRCLAEKSKFHEALSIVEELEFDENSDLGMNLLAAECYLQLGRENKAQKAIKKVEKLLMKPPMCDVEDVISLAQDFTDNCSPVRALLLFRIAGDMLKKSTLPPDKIVEGIFRCIEEMNDSVQPLHDFEKYNAAHKLTKMGKALKKINEQPSGTIVQFRKPINRNMDTRKGTKGVVLNERSGLIAIDYGVEVMEKMLEDLCFMTSAVECVDPENFAVRQALLCNSIAENYQNTRQHEKAIKLLKVGLARLKNHFGENVGKLKVYIRTLTNIAIEYRNSEKYYEAEQTELKALAEIDFDNEEKKRIRIEYIKDQLKTTRRHIKLMKHLETLPFWPGN